MTRVTYPTVMRAGGHVHLTETIEGLPFTLCGRLVRRKGYRHTEHTMAEATCERCWTVAAARMPARGKAAA